MLDRVGMSQMGHYRKSPKAYFFISPRIRTVFSSPRQNSTIRSSPHFRRLPDESFVVRHTDMLPIKVAEHTCRQLRRIHHVIAARTASTIGLHANQLEKARTSADAPSSRTCCLRKASARVTRPSQTR
jgi:hypothetical protein